MATIMSPFLYSSSPIPLFCLKKEAFLKCTIIVCAMALHKNNGKNMSNSQSMLSLGALLLLSLVSLRFNSSVLDNTTVETENKVYLTAFSLADDLIEEIKQKAFDANTVNISGEANLDVSNNARIGSAATGGVLNQAYMDEWRIYNRLLTTEELDAYYALG